MINGKKPSPLGEYSTGRKLAAALFIATTSPVRFRAIIPTGSRSHIFCSNNWPTSLRIIRIGEQDLISNLQIIPDSYRRPPK
ncbi:MAG TPA: hypothetical protein GXX25_04720 [Desulfotomaculum sp.]|nr:hypothetical protein [Desulfotomaculum sp.]